MLKVSTEWIVENILKKKSIVQYLKDRGIYPIRHLSGGRVAYLCPLPGHAETKPSFIVWTAAEFENFYCFGCMQCCNIIHLVRLIEDISFQDALIKLADGLEIKIEHGIERELNLYLDKTKQKSHKIDIVEMALSISTMCNSYLKSTQYNSVEMELIEKLYAIIDKDIYNFNFDGIEEIYRALPNMIEQRRKRWRTFLDTQKDHHIATKKTKGGE